MTRSEVVVQGRAHVVSTLDPQAPGHVAQALVLARVVDVLTGDPVRTSARMTTSLAAMVSRSTADAVVGLLGTPSRVFPSLRAQAYTVPVRISAPGYAPRDETAVVAAAPSFPGSFVPADLGVLTLLPVPVTVTLATYEDAAGPGVVALGGVDVQVARSWGTVGRLGGPATVEPLLAVAPGLVAPRPVGATVDVPVLSAPPEPSRVLTASVTPGATRLSVSALGAVSTGDVVAVDGGDPDRPEWLEVLAVSTGVSAGSAGELELRFPVQVSHGAGAPVRRFLPPAPAAVQGVLTVGALAGSRTLVLGALGAVAAGQVVRVSGGSSAPEFQVARLYRTSTDAGGAGRLPPLTGLAAVEVTAVAGARTAARLATLTRPAPTSSLDLTLR